MKALAPAYRTRQWRPAGCLIRVLTLVALVCLPGCRRSESESSISDFTLPEVRGGVFHAHAADRPRVLLVAFLQTVPDTPNTPSRQQVPSLLSMQHQYGACGLKVVIIDASALVTDPSPANDALINASYDWHLDVPLLRDEDNRVAMRSGVTQVPTLILVASDGSVAQRWNRLTGPSTLARGVEQLCGGPLQKNSR